MLTLMGYNVNAYISSVYCVYRLFIPIFTAAYRLKYLYRVDHMREPSMKTPHFFASLVSFKISLL